MSFHGLRSMSVPVFVGCLENKARDSLMKGNRCLRYPRRSSFPCGKDNIGNIGQRKASKQNTQLHRLVVFLTFRMRSRLAVAFASNTLDMNALLSGFSYIAVSLVGLQQLGAAPPLEVCISTSRIGSGTSSLRCQGSICRTYCAPLASWSSG